MVMSSEHQLKLFSRTKETLGKHLLHYRPNIFAYCENAGVCALFPHSVRNIRNRKCQIFTYFTVLVFALDNFLEIKLLCVAYY